MRSRYTLDELLSQCDLNGPFPEEVKAWEQADPVGEEWWVESESTRGSLFREDSRKEGFNPE